MSNRDLGLYLSLPSISRHWCLYHTSLGLSSFRSSEGLTTSHLLSTTFKLCLSAQIITHWILSLTRSKLDDVFNHITRYVSVTKTSYSLEQLERGHIIIGALDPKRIATMT
jgi:hypothetical protein